MVGLLGCKYPSIYIYIYIYIYMCVWYGTFRGKGYTFTERKVLPVFLLLAQIGSLRTHTPEVDTPYFLISFNYCWLLWL